MKRIVLIYLHFLQIICTIAQMMSVSYLYYSLYRDYNLYHIVFVCGDNACFKHVHSNRRRKQAELKDQQI